MQPSEVYMGTILSVGTRVNKKALNCSVKLHTEVKQQKDQKR